jgi:hypothetical protein
VLLTNIVKKKCTAQVSEDITKLIIRGMFFKLILKSPGA